MYKIKILKKQKKEKVPKPPRFKNKYEELLWYRKQKMKAQLLQIKHVSIQYKDIQKMLFEHDRRLINLYMRTDFSQIDDLNKYMQISRFKDGCDIIVALIINSDWLVNQDELEKKTIEEIDQECLNTQQQIDSLKQQPQTEETQNRIILLEYKLETIREYLDKQKSLTL